MVASNFELLGDVLQGSPPFFINVLGEPFPFASPREEALECPPEVVVLRLLLPTPASFFLPTLMAAFAALLFSFLVCWFNGRLFFLSSGAPLLLLSSRWCRGREGWPDLDHGSHRKWGRGLRSLAGRHRSRGGLGDPSKLVLHRRLSCGQVL